MKKKTDVKQEALLSIDWDNLPKIKDDGMPKIDVNDLVMGENVRDDMSIDPEVVDSIVIRGIHTAIKIEKKKNQNIVTYGHLRITHCKAAIKKCIANKHPERADQIKMIPYSIFSGTEEERYFLQHDENDRRRELNPVEKGKSYKEFMAKYGVDDTYLAQKLHKTVEYVRRRVLITNLSDEIKKDLVSGNIQIGHALLMAKMDNESANKFLKEIKRCNLSVAAAKSNIEYHNNSKRLSDAKFDQAACKDCKHNGSVQSELFETGKTLDGKCLNPGCYGRKVADLVKERKEQFKEVLFKSESDWEEPKGFIQKDSYAAREQGLTAAYLKKCRDESNPEKYLVKVRSDGSIVEYFKPTKKESPKQQAKEAAVNKETKLAEKIDKFRSDLLQEKGTELTKVDSKELKAMMVWHFIQGTYEYEFDEVKAILDLEADEVMTDPERLFKLKEEVLDKALHAAATGLFNEIALNDTELLQVAAKAVGFSYKEQFQMSQEYLDLYTKEELAALMKELKIENTLKATAKRNEYIDLILTNWKKGQVPKILEE